MQDLLGRCIYQSKFDNGCSTIENFIRQPKTWLCLLLFKIKSIYNTNEHIVRSNPFTYASQFRLLCLTIFQPRKLGVSFKIKLMVEDTKFT